MKLKKFKYLLAVSSAALAIAPIASIAINSNNTIAKTNIANNNAAESGTTNYAQTPNRPTNVDLSTLSPQTNDLYNVYNYKLGYVVKDVAKTTISFYDWFNQKVWQLDIKTVLNNIDSTNKTIKTMNVKGALKSDGTYDTKLFVYGNLVNNTSSSSTSSITTSSSVSSSSSSNSNNNTANTTAGSYVFAVDMVTGEYIPKSLVENIEGNADNKVYSTTLIGDIDQLTVVDQNTVVVCSHITNQYLHYQDENKSWVDTVSHTLSISVLTFSDTNYPAVQSMSTDFGGHYNFTFGSVLGLIKKENQYVFAISTCNPEINLGITSTNSYNTNDNLYLKVYYWYFKQSGNNLVQTNFDETSPIDTTDSVNTKPFDIQTIINSIPVSQITVDGYIRTSSSSISTTTTEPNNIVPSYTTPEMRTEIVQNWLETKCANFSVVYPGTTTNPKMMLSYNWDSTDLSPDAKANDSGKNKVTLVQFNPSATLQTNNKDAVIFGIYKMPDNIGTNIPMLGITNLIYNRVKDNSGFIQPYAVVVGEADYSHKPTIWFNLVKLETTKALSNTSVISTNSTIDGNNTQVAYTSSCFATTDAYTTDGNQVNSDNSNIKKMGWQLQFIPGSGIKDNSGSIKNYYGYISYGTEKYNSSYDTKTYSALDNLPKYLADYLRRYSSGYSYSYSITTTKVTSDGINYQQDYISLPVKSTQNTLVNELGYGYQFGITDSQLNQIYKRTVSSDSVLNPNSFATDATKESILANLKQVYKYEISNSTTVSSYATINNWSKDDSVIISNFDANNLVVNQQNGTIKGYVTFDVKNWWNDNTTSIKRDINLQLSDPNYFNFDLSNNNNNKGLDDSTSNSDPKSVAKWLEAKYSFNSLFPNLNSNTASPQLISFLQDLLTNANMGTTLKALLKNSLTASQSGSSNAEAGTNSGSTSAQLQNLLYSSTNTLQSANANTDINVGNYIVVTPNSANQSLTVKFNLPSYVVGNNQSSQMTLNYKNFSGKLKSSDTGYSNYQTWKVYGTVPASDNSSLQLEIWMIAVIVVAILLVIVIATGIFFIVKKHKRRKNW